MRKVIFSKRASKQLEVLLDYLEIEWSVKVRDEFIEKLDRSLFQVQMFPESCASSAKAKDLHRLVVTKQNSLFYRYNHYSINIVAIFDNRMNPDRLKDIKITT